jgi:hypothetical protein
MYGHVRATSAVRAVDRRLAERLIACGPPWLRRVGAGVEEAAEHTKLWCVVAAVMAVAGGRGGARRLRPWPSPPLSPADWPTAGAIYAVLAVMVAVERVHSGAHCPSDVAAGAVIGLASAWLVRRLPHLLVRHWL